MHPMTFKIGDPAPSILLNNAEEKAISLDTFKGKWVVLYFYPKDNTPGCTIEANEFSAALPQFKKLGAEIIGLSPDSCKSHRSFIEKQGLKIHLLSDPEKSVLQAYGVWQEKKNYGKTYMGVVRSTFLINPEGKIAEIWEKVKVKGHVNAVLQSLKEQN